MRAAGFAAFGTSRTISALRTFSGCGLPARINACRLWLATLARATTGFGTGFVDETRGIGFLALLAGALSDCDDAILAESMNRAASARRVIAGAAVSSCACPASVSIVDA